MFSATFQIIPTHSHGWEPLLPYRKVNCNMWATSGGGLTKAMASCVFTLQKNKSAAGLMRAMAGHHSGWHEKAVHIQAEVLQTRPLRR